MVRSAPFSASMIALCVSVAAVGLYSSSLHQLGATTTTTQAVRDLLPLAAMVALLAAVAFIYGQLHQHARAVAAGAGTEVAAVAASAAVGLLIILQDDGTRPRAVGAAAAHVLPAAATVTFFLGTALVFVHGSGAVPGTGGAPAARTPMRILTKLTLGAAAGVIVLMALALYG